MLDGEGSGANERGVTNGGALGSAGGLKAASKLSAVHSEISGDQCQALLQCNLFVSLLDTAFIM